MNCWKCGSSIDQLGKKISFRATCDRCAISLHCCKNCKNYDPERHNSCAIPGTDSIADRETNNFCEQFELSGKFVQITSTNQKKNFNDLFK